MPSVRVGLSLDAAVAELLRRRAREAGKPIGQFLSALILDDERRRIDALAEEGYRLLSEETREFAEQALCAFQEVLARLPDEACAEGW